MIYKNLTRFILIILSISWIPSFTHAQNLENISNRDSFLIEEVWDSIPEKGKRAFLRIATKLDSTENALQDSKNLNKLLLQDRIYLEHEINVNKNKIYTLEEELKSTKKNNRIMLFIVGLSSFLFGITIK